MLKKLHENFSIFPAKPDKSPAVRSWTPYRTSKIEFEKLKGHNFFAIACGFENLEVIDIDNHFNDADDLFSKIYNSIDLSKYPIIKTGGGGYHIYYKCETIEGNKKLAQRVNDKKRPETLIETRGTGGYVISPPSEGYEVISGDILEVPMITKDERDDILDVCRSLNEVIGKKENPDTKLQIEGISPIDKYLQDSSSVRETIDLLKSNGWSSDNDFNFRRPGKSEGFSATFGADKLSPNKFYVFSSNAYPFEPETSYTMAGVRAILCHNGDYKELAKELGKRYGIKPKAKAKAANNLPDQNKLPEKWRVLTEIINDWQLRFRFNELTKVVECSRDGGKYETIAMLTGDIVCEMETRRGIKAISSAKVDEMIKNTTICEIYNPIKNYFKNIPKWDKKDHFTELCKYIKLDIEEKPEFFKSMLIKHFIRTIRCALTDYTNRMVFTLHGPQEVGKSMFFRWSIDPEIYNEEPIDPTDKDSILALSRYVIMNMDDIDSLNKKEVSKLKGFISKGSITKRVAYGRTEEKFNRVASFVASTNKSDILADDSNTRWIILKIKSFDWRGYTKNVDPLQLWAQAGAMLKENIDAGELNDDEKHEREHRNNNQFLETSIERELLIKYFKEGEKPMTATEILLQLQQMTYSVKLNMHQLTRELKRLYGDPVSKRENGRPGRWYYVEPPASRYPEEPSNFYESKERELNDAPF